MRILPFLTVVSLVAVALAGCGDGPSSGTFTTDRDDLVAQGEVHLQYQERVRPLGQEGAPCPPPEIPLEEVQCKEPFTKVRAHFMELRDPSSEAYTLFFVGPDGELEIGALQRNETGERMYDLEREFSEDHSAAFDAVELRMGGTVIATAGASGSAANTFAAREELTQIRAEGEWEGTFLTFTVSGALPDVSYQAWLVSEDEAGELVHEQPIPVDGNGEHSFEAGKSIDAFKEFHIHLTGSKVNVAIADL